MAIRIPQSSNPGRSKIILYFFFIYFYLIIWECVFIYFLTNQRIEPLTLPIFALFAGALHFSLFLQIKGFTIALNRLNIKL